MFRGVLPWQWSGLVMALIFFAAVLFVKPIGVSTQFVIFNGVLWDAVQNDIVVEDASAPKGYASPNAYLNKSSGKYAASIAQPLNYSFVFVLAMIVGAFLSAILKGDRPQTKEEKEMPDIWRARFGNSKIKHYIWMFIAGFAVLFGARLAGGCTSGHIMSGIMQTSLSGYVFALSTFGVAVPLAIIVFKRK
ncbi:MAG: YeeE/YedE thiosulfate transporter family protein [Alphaproteobacteria bacterium]